MEIRSKMRGSQSSVLDPAILVPAVSQSFIKLDPRAMLRNPVMFVLESVAAVATAIFFREAISASAELWFTLQIAIWLWITVLFANFAEAVAEGRGKAQAATLRRARTETMAKRLLLGSSGCYEADGLYEMVAAPDLKPGDLVLVEAGDSIPSDGEVVEGVASVDESAITGESAPVIRESGGDRSAVTGGTRVLSDWIKMRITAAQGSTFLDRMIALVEGAERQKTPNEIALNILLDAILARGPKLVLVDELAHSNAPGSRHPKRYLDADELLDAGIDVYATLNIQHVESLNDVVAQITGIRVRETVPDSIIDRAGDVEVIDLTPEDLIQRLEEGKVYLPQAAERAIRGYFQRGNLTALRELALRRTAQRVDEQMVDYMRAHAISGPWAAGERVLVCVNEDPNGLAVIRYARRLADRLRAPWTAIHAETSRVQRLSEADRDRIAEGLRLAERLGGEAVTVPAADVADAVIEYAQANNFTHVVIAKSRRSRWSEWLRGSVTHRLIRRACDISVHVIAEKSAPAAPEPPAAGARPRALIAPHAIGGSMGLVGVALGIGVGLEGFVGHNSVALVFLAAVLGSAIAYGLAASLLACLLSVLAYNFFFLPPLYTFTISDPENVVALFVFAAVAVIVSNLTARVRSEALVARQRAGTTEQLYQFSRKLSGALTLDDLLWATAYQIAAMLNVHVVLLLPDADTVVVRAGYPPEDMLDAADLAAAKWCWQNNHPAGRGADTLPGARRLFLPMPSGRAPVGVIGLDSERPGPLLTPDRRRLLDALADQAAIAIERLQLMQDVDRARVAAETERLRAALLTSISHDLRTPLAAILGSATSLKAYRSVLDEATTDDLVRTIQEEAERLNRFIANLLDMTRLESGALAPKDELVDLAEVVGSAAERAMVVLAGHRVQIDMPADLPMLRLDPILFEQALFNLLDNAGKYAKAGSLVLVRARREGDVVRLEVADEGPGIPSAGLERIFDKFYRIHGSPSPERDGSLPAADRQQAGTGLGLAICRGFIEAMGGAIVAGNRTDRPGAVFTLTLPAPTEAAAA